MAEPAAAWVWPGGKREARSLVGRGDDALALGSVGAARQTYEYAAEQMRWPTAALALAATYDPHEIKALGLSTMAEPETARLWYERSRELMNARIDFQTPGRASAAHVTFRRMITLS